MDWAGPINDAAPDRIGRFPSGFLHPPGCDEVYPDAWKETTEAGILPTVRFRPLSFNSLNQRMPLTVGGGSKVIERWRRVGFTFKRDIPSCLFDNLKTSHRLVRPSFAKLFPLFFFYHFSQTTLHTVAHPKCRLMNSLSGQRSTWGRGFKKEPPPPPPPPHTPLFHSSI